MGRGMVVLRVVAGAAAGFLGYARNDMGVWWEMMWGAVGGMMGVGDAASRFLGYARNDMGDGAGNDGGRGCRGNDGGDG